MNQRCWSNIFLVIFCFAMLLYAGTHFYIIHWEDMFVAFGTMLLAYFTWNLAITETDEARRERSTRAFNDILDIFSSKEARDVRRYIYDNFKDYTILEDANGEKMKLWIKFGEKVDCIHPKIEKLIELSEKKEKFEELVVRLDRVGFILFDSAITKEFKEKYLKWMCVSISEHWNRTAPHIIQIKDERGKYVPYFELMVYEAYKYYKDEKDDAKIICLNSTCEGNET